MNNNLVNKLPEDFRCQFGQVRVLLRNGKEAFYIHAFLFFLLELALDFIRLNLQGIHNHLIFNAVSFTDYKHYHSNKRSYHYIRRTSDRICKEHGLSVIIPGKDKGKSYIEHQAAQAGTSYKAALKKAIDRLIPGSADFEDLLLRLQREGYLKEN